MPTIISTILLFDLSGCEMRVEPGEGLFMRWLFYRPSSYMIVSPIVHPIVARQAQQQQMRTTATMAMMRVVLFFLGSASGMGVGSNVDIRPPLGMNIGLRNSIIFWAFSGVFVLRIGKLVGFFLVISLPGRITR
jgi:hypothetical protein